ncbi:MAG: zinc-dependent metalloprotease [Kofleriaceae bacterium]
MAALAGCAGDAEPDEDANVLTGDDLLVPIARELDPALAARRAQIAPGGQRSGNTNKTFYLAVRKSALEQKWFWSVYLEQLQPFGPSPGTLGTRVVRFRQENDKLFVFDADDRRATSDVFNPDLIIDAFPIVEDEHFHSLPGSGNYVLIDPGAGFNRFGAVADWFGASEVKMQTELSFVEDFHASSDGGRYEQIVTLYSDFPIGFPDDVDPNDYRMSATMSVNIRKYSEGAGYVEVPAPPVTHYFLGDPKISPNTGIVAQNAVHWNFHPGMQPIKWVIGREILDLQADPALGGANLFESMKRGIESWNAVFGYPVFKAQLASPSDSFGDDRTNFLIVDPDTSVGFAYADWRTNPNTAEIRGASVYFSAAFFSPFDDDPAVMPAPTAATPHRKRLTLKWNGTDADPLCVRYADERGRITGTHGANLTGAQKLEAYIQEVTAHEIGHTLGLRHNFKGSLEPPTSSVMDYNLTDAAFVQPTPGPYDHQAIEYLYGISPDLPTSQFCTDEDTLFDPNCVRFDPPTPAPLYDYQIPNYQLYTSFLLDGGFPPDLADLIVQFFGQELYGYARAGTPDEARDAWTAALDGARPPVSPTAVPEAVDALTAAVFREILIDPGAAITTPFTDPFVVAGIANDGKAAIINADHMRSFPTRRIVVDALKNAQTTEAFVALRDARTAVAATLGGLTGTEAALTSDLLARIDAALSPYFQ